MINAPVAVIIIGISLAMAVLSVAFFNGHNKVEEVAESVIDKELHLPAGTTDAIVEITGIDNVKEK